MKENNPHDIKVGQTLYYEYLIKGKKEIRELVVSKIGSKYFDCYKTMDRFNLSDLRHEVKDYQQWNYQLYTSKQELLDEWEKEELSCKIKRYFGFSSKNTLTIDQLKLIANIIDLNGE